MYSLGQAVFTAEYSGCTQITWYLEAVTGPKISGVEGVMIRAETLGPVCFNHLNCQSIGSWIRGMQV